MRACHQSSASSVLRLFLPPIMVSQRGRAGKLNCPCRKSVFKEVWLRNRDLDDSRLVLSFACAMVKARSACWFTRIMPSARYGFPDHVGLGQK